jgi:RND family efflux transporter MFP subunit
MADNNMEMGVWKGMKISGLRWTIGLMCLLCILNTACGQKPAKASFTPPTVSVVRPVMSHVKDYLELTGSTQATDTVQLRARVAGYLDKVFFQDGQQVKKDQPLFLIQQDTYRANLQQAEAAIAQQKAQLEYAAAQFLRYSNLLSQNAASQTDVDNWRNQRDAAQANLLAAEARRELARLDLGYTEIKAPFDGRIDRRQKDPGNLVGSGESTVLAEINRIDPIYVYFSISDIDLARLMNEAKWAPGIASGKMWPLYAGVSGEEGFPHQGRLDFASISLAPTSGTLLLRGVLPNPKSRILPGLYARVRLPLKEKEAFVIPQEAIQYDQRGSYVLALDEGDTVQRISVKTGPLAETGRSIDEGLTGKEWVIAKGMQKAVPGKKVTPERLESPQPDTVSSQSENVRKR